MGCLIPNLCKSNLTRMKTNFKTFLLYIIILFPLHAISQEKEGFKFDRGRLYTGGNFGLQFGNSTLIDISPELGYFITEKISIGTGVVYQHYGFKDKAFPSSNFKTNIYGSKMFLRYHILENFFAHAEYEALNLETQFFDRTNLRHTSTRFWVHSVLVGGGYRQRIGEYSSLNIMLLYNINETIDSPYSNPIFRMGFNIGL